jgi:hypothetical protein
MVYFLASSWYFDARDGAFPGEVERRRFERLHQGRLPGRTESVVVPSAGVAAPPARGRLRQLLREGEFEHADLLTTFMLLEAARRLDVGWLRPADASELPGPLLDEVDAAWATTTRGRHGLHRQAWLYRVRSAHGTDFPQLAAAYGWRGQRSSARPSFGESAAIPRYAEFVAREHVPDGFFPTLRNPQIERTTAWYDRWRKTVAAVHLRYQSWEGST